MITFSVIALYTSKNWNEMSCYAHSVSSLQGGFAKCYELQDLDTKEIFAGKIVSKTLLVKQHQKDKVWFTSDIKNQRLKLSLERIVY